MAHEKVYGICENKCRVEVYPKTNVYAKTETYNKTEVDAKYSSMHETTNTRFEQIEADIAEINEKITAIQEYCSSLDQRITALGG